MKVKKIKPLYTRIVTTMDMYTDDQAKGPGGIIDASKLKQGIKEYQTVISVGTSVRNLKVGDIVCIDPSRYAVRKYAENSLKKDLLTDQVVSYNFNVVNINDKDCLLLDESDIEFVIEDFEE